MTRRVIDVQPLPNFAFSHRSPMWWGTIGLIAIEATVFALAIAAYVYLKGRNTNWPPGFPPPALFWGTLNTIILLVSVVPNELTKRAAERLDLRKVHLWLVVSLAFAAVFNIVRIFEFTALNVWWDSNAYGSIVWVLIGLHTAHTLTDFLDSTVLTVLMFTGPLEEQRFVDVSENSVYWYFVVLSWLPIYAVVYFAPRVA